jgi:hypothetical protein
VRTDDAAPTGLKIIVVWGSTNMPRLTALKNVAKIAQPFMAGLNVINTKQVPSGTVENVFRP